MTRVLIVDDEPDLLDAWSFALELAGYSVDRANDGKTALALMNKRVPDLVITDLMMPGMNGDELCLHLRAKAEWAAVPILLHTSAYVATSANQPWNEVLRKPARMDAFLAVVAKLVLGTAKDD